MTLNERWSLSMDASHDAASACSFAQSANTTMPQNFMAAKNLSHSPQCAGDALASRHPVDEQVAPVQVPVLKLHRLLGHRQRQHSLQYSSQTGRSCALQLPRGGNISAVLGQLLRSRMYWRCVSTERQH